MQNLNLQYSSKVRLICGPLIFFLIFLILSSAALATGIDDATLQSVDQGQAIARNSTQPSVEFTDLSVSVGQAQHPRTDSDMSPLERLRLWANELSITWGTIPSPTLYLPYITHLYTQTEVMSLSERMGFGLTSAALAPYTDVTTLNAGWYLDWRVRAAPERPNGIDYVQMIRVHQKLACGQWYHGDRAACPYAEPLDYQFRPDQTSIEAAAAANPGALWLIGNEMDRVDWSYCEQWNGSHCDVVAHNGQDEILPATYAVAYHDLYQIIKSADPSARVAIGGVIQPTPLRLAYLSAIWDAYQATYSVTMPVDVWNVHNFIIREKAKDWGADIPPGIEAAQGEYVLSDSEPQSFHIDMAIFQSQIIAFRQWMKAHGEQHKPLVVSEYGVLFPNGLIGISCSSQGTACVQNFMIDTFDFFATAKDCSLGYINDQCRLVQQWNWYSLDDTWGSFNIYSRLFDPSTKEITETGERFRAYIAENE